MGAYSLELNYRLGTSFGLSELARLLDVVVQEMAFDDGHPFDLVVEFADGRQSSEETAASRASGLLKDLAWPSVHQIRFSNHWIKDMNVKLHLVRRQDYTSMSAKGELPSLEYRERLINRVDEFLAAFVAAPSSSGASPQERERLFGSMLFTDQLVRQTRDPFLAGDFRGALSAAAALILDRLRTLLNQSLLDITDVSRLIDADPPRLLFPDVSGRRLHIELRGMASLLTGLLTLLDPIVRGEEPAPEEPARILKYLVLASLLLERLDGAVANPAAPSSDLKTLRRTGRVKPSGSRSRAVRSKAVRKPAARTSQVKKKANAPARKTTVGKKAAAKKTTVRKASRPGKRN